MSLNYLFTSEFLFDPLPPYQSEFYLPLIIIFSLMMASAILAKILGSKMIKAADGFFNPFLAGSLLGFLHLFSRYEGLPWLASRIFLLVTLAVSLGWVLILLIKIIRSLPKAIKEQTVEERYKKYLPKPKR